MKSIGFFLVGLTTGLLLFGMVGLANAATIKPSSVLSSSTYFSYDENNLINGNGLNTITGLHGTTHTGMWMSDSGSSGDLTFDLGGLYNLTSTNIWQYNYKSTSHPTIDYFTRGVKDFDILTSTDGINFNLVLATSLTKSPGGPISSQDISFTSLASFVKFDIHTNFGRDRVGLSEVRFEGIPGDPVPEPATMLLFGIGLLGLAGVSRRK